LEQNLVIRILLVVVGLLLFGSTIYEGFASGWATDFFSVSNVFAIFAGIVLILIGILATEFGRKK
jgi:hypothetical protein